VLENKQENEQSHVKVLPISHHLFLAAENVAFAGPGRTGPSSCWQDQVSGSPASLSATAPHRHSSLPFLSHLPAAELAHKAFGAVTSWHFCWVLFLFFFFFFAFAI
jgi:hypothetical protein